MFFQAANSGSNSWWQYLFGVIIVALGYLFGQIPLGIVVIWAAQKQGDISAVNDFASSLDFAELGLSSNFGFALALIMFLGALLGLWIAIKYLHNRPFSTLINPFQRIRWSRFFWGLLVWLAFGILAECISWFFNPGDYHLQFDAGSFFILAIIALILIPFQASFEELFVRGYLMQGIGLGTQSKVFAMIATSFVFGALHLMNPEISEFGLETMIVYYVLVGLFLAAITVMDDGLELAMGVHTATNLYGSLIITFEGSALQTPALIKLDSPDVQIMLLLLVLSATAFMIIASKKYSWSDWNKLTSRIETSSTDSVVTTEEDQ